MEISNQLTTLVDDYIQTPLKFLMHFYKHLLYSTLSAGSPASALPPLTLPLSTKAYRRSRNPMRTFLDPMPCYRVGALQFHLEFHQIIYLDYYGGPLLNSTAVIHYYLDNLCPLQ